MPPVVIDNPILNSPFAEPARHFRFDDDGITNEIAEGRRRSTYFIPIPKARVKGGQIALAGDFATEQARDNDFINRVREHVGAWRSARYPGITAVTRELLTYWQEPSREKPLFFCQVEALETAIFLAEVAGHRQPWIENKLREDSQARNPGLYRIAFKMATGSGKTVVMAMLIAWQALNKLANPQDKRFSDTFLVVTPGITIRDRLQVLRPNLQGNYYQERDLLTPDQLHALQAAKIEIANFHGFIRRETFDAASLTKKVLAGPNGDPDRFKETPDQMVRRVCRALGTKKNIVVLNDEAHHCYQSAPQSEEEKLGADERAEARRDEEAARVWLNGLRAVQHKLGIRAIYDLSATPFFLRGSGYREGTLFPWVVSDFGLIDAIEAGIVKIPRVPVSDDSVAGDSPTYRDLWPKIREDLSRRGRATDAVQSEPRLPKELEGALRSLYGNYEKSYRAWSASGTGTPPVFIVVCQNTTISKSVFDWIAGWPKTLADGSTVPVPGALPIFSNVEGGLWSERPNTLLIDSAQLESGEAMDPAFKKIAAAEIDEFKADYRARFPGRSVDEITDEDLLREVMNTIGKKDRLGEQRIMPILRPYDPIGSTQYVDFTTTKPVYTTGKSHLNCLVMDSGWEAKLGQVLDDMDEVVAYAKNQGLNFRIPYTFEGEAADYVTDLIVRYDDGEAEPLNLLIEVTGEHRREKAAKVAVAETYWIPAVNNHGGLGRWSFLEVSDPWDAANLIRAHVAALAPAKALA